MYKQNDVKIERQELIEYFIKHEIIRSNVPTIGIKIKYGLTFDMFDLWTSWIENDMYYLIPQVNGVNKNIILPFKTINFKGHNFLVPNQSEELLNHIYVNWQVEIPSKYLKSPTQILL